MFEDLKLIIHWTESMELSNMLGLEDEDKVFIGEDAYVALATMNYMDKKLFNYNLFENRGYAKTKVSLEYKGNEIISGGRIDLSDLEFRNESSPFKCLLDENDSETERILIENLLAEEQEYLKTHDLSHLNDYKAWLYQYEIDSVSFEKYKANAKYPKEAIFDWREDESSGNIVFTSFYNMMDLNISMQEVKLRSPVKLLAPEGLPVDQVLEKIEQLTLFDNAQNGDGSWCHRTDGAHDWQALAELSKVHKMTLDWQKAIYYNLYSNKQIIDVPLRIFTTTNLSLWLGHDKGYSTHQYLGEGLQGSGLFTKDEVMALGWHLSATSSWYHDPFPLPNQDILDPLLADQISGEIRAFMRTPEYKDYHLKAQQLVTDSKLKTQHGIYKAFLKELETGRHIRYIETTVANACFEALNREEYCFTANSSTGESFKFTAVPKEDLVRDASVYVELMNQGYTEKKIKEVFEEHAPMTGFYKNYAQLVETAANAVIKHHPDLYSPKQLKVVQK